MAVNIAFEKFRLSNGLDVILHEDHSVPVAAVNVWYHVGSQNEEPDRTGFAHLFEHIMFKGSKHHNREYFMPLQEVGANVNGSTSTDRTNYYENVPAEYLELALWLEADRMGFLLDALDQESFDVEREVVKNERRQSYENRPYGLAGQEIRKALFPPNHPYHWQTIGSQEHLDAASLEDVKDFFRRFYAPNNASLAIAGDIDPVEAKAMVEKYFGDLAPAPSAPRMKRWMPGLDDEVRLHLDDRVQLTRLYFAWLGPPRFDADEAPLDVLVSILGEGRSSRLYRGLVYQQLAREANAHYGAMEIAGEIRMDATVTPGANLADVERALLAEVERLQVEPPRDEEVQRAINRLEAHHVRQIESVGGFGGRANLLNSYNVFARDPGLINRDLERYQAVTPADVQRVARTYFGSGRVRLVVSPKEAVAPASVEIDRTQQPGPGRPRAFRPPVPQRLSLAGGLDLLVVEKHEVPTLAAAIYVPGGALTDPAKAPGLSALTTRLMTEGTSRRTSQQIAEESDFIAARLGIDVHREYMVASTGVLTQHWPKALDLLSDVLTNPVFPEHEVERIRRERLTDLRRLRDDAGAMAERASNAVLYGRDTPYGHPMSGREDAIAAISRAALVDQHTSLRGARPTFLVVGDVDVEIVARQIEEALGSWHLPEQNVRTDTIHAAAPLRISVLQSLARVGAVLPAEHRDVLNLRFVEDRSHQEVAEMLGKSVVEVRQLQVRALRELHRVSNEDGAVRNDGALSAPVGNGSGGSPQSATSRNAGQTTIYLVDKPAAAQSVITAGHLGVSRLDPDYLPLVVMNMAFGGQFTARLNMNLREDKGYTYGYRSGFDWRLARSRFTAGGSVQTAVTREALFETLKEFRDLHGARPLTEDEVEKARLGLIRGYPPTFETAGQILGRLLDLVHYGLGDDYYSGQVERLQAVTLDDVHRVSAERIDPNQLSIVIVGDRAAIEPRLEELNLPIVHLNHEGDVVD